MGIKTKGFFCFLKSNQRAFSPLIPSSDALKHHIIWQGNKDGMPHFIKQGFAAMAFAFCVFQ